MAVTYTADELKNRLRQDGGHGYMYAFALKKMELLGHKFTVENLFARRFTGGKDGVIVSTGASSLSEAVEWAKDGLREWAFTGAPWHDNYFGRTVREWAISQKNSTARCCGSTVDFVYLFSGASSKNLNTLRMYPLTSHVEKDVGDLVLWTFTNMFSLSVVEFAAFHTHPVPIEGPSEDQGPPGLHRDYWESLDTRDQDQTHHFAFYFAVGLKVGSNLGVLLPFLTATKDWDPIPPAHIKNAGDYYLGLTAARLGNKLRNAPGFRGAEIAETLLRPSPDKANKIDQVAPWLLGWWSVYDGNQYYYFFSKDSRVVYTKTLPKNLQSPPAKPLNSGKVAITEHGLKIVWNPAYGGQTKEEFTRLGWTSETEMNGVSNRYAPLFARKLK